jgi:predicted metalloprotease with PDZ domain
MPNLRRWLCLLFLCPVWAAADIHYTLQPNPKAHAVEVSISLDKGPTKQEFRIPAWCPGFYFIENYQTQISAVNATGAKGEKLSISHDDPRAWVVDNPTGNPLTMSYVVSGNDTGLGFFGVNVKDDKAFTNGAATFMFLPDRLTERDTLTVHLPPEWKIATAMDTHQDGDYVASGYDELIDNPIQMGNFVLKTFTVHDIPFQAVFVAPSDQIQINVDDEVQHLRQESETAVNLFGSAPFKHYTFIFHFAVGNFDGGLEHRASCVLALPNEDQPIDDLTAHEFFHAWNVKQIRPKVLGPFDYTKPDRTANLWFAEGVTDYYSKLITYRSGLGDEGWLLKQFGEQMSELEQSVTRNHKTVAEASWEAWENGGFGIGDLSFYTKGFMIGMLLDIQIRTTTNGTKSLDDVMRLLYSKYHLPEPGYEENGLLAALNEVCGQDMSKLYNSMVKTTEDLPYALLQKIGLRYHPNTDNIAGQPDMIVERDPDATDDQKKLLDDYLKVVPPPSRG